MHLSRSRVPDVNAVLAYAPSREARRTTLLRARVLSQCGALGAMAETETPMEVQVASASEEVSKEGPAAMETSNPPPELASGGGCGGVSNESEEAEPSRQPSYAGTDSWVAEANLEDTFGTAYNENEFGGGEKLRTLVNFEITDDKGQLVSIDSLDKHSNGGYKGPFKVRGYLLPPVDVRWKEVLPQHASSSLNREMGDALLKEAAERNGTKGANAMYSAGCETADGRLERTLLRVGTDMDGYSNSMCSWTYAKVAEVRGSMVKVNFKGQGKAKPSHDEWVERTSERLAPRGSKLDRGEASLDSEKRPWFEPEMLHKMLKEKSGVDPFDDSVMGKAPVEIDGIEDWCMDYTYCQPSLWIISTTGAWYRIAGVHCPGGHYGAPTAAYKPFFESLTTKFATCAHVAMVILDFYSSSCKLTVQDVCAEVTARTNGKINETHILANHILVHDQMCALPRPEEWGKHIKVIDQSVFVTALPKVGAAAIGVLEETRKRRIVAKKLLMSLGIDISSITAETAAPPVKVGRKSKAEKEEAAAAAAKARPPFISDLSRRMQETPEERAKCAEREMQMKVLISLQQRRYQPPVDRLNNAKTKLPLQDAYLWEIEFNAGRLPEEMSRPTTGPLSNLEARGIAADLTDQLVSVWVCYINFAPLLGFPYLSLEELAGCLTDDGSKDAGSCTGKLLEEWFVRVLSKCFVERNYHAEPHTGMPLPFSFFDKLPMVARSKTLSPHEEEALARAERTRLRHPSDPKLVEEGQKAEGVLRRQLSGGECWYEVLRVCVAETGKTDLCEYIDPVHDCLKLIDQVMDSNIALTFSQPVNKRQVRGYSDVVKHPQDLGSIRAKIVQGYYDVDTIDRKKQTHNDVKVSSGYADPHTLHQGIYHDVQTVWNNCFLYFNATADPSNKQEGTEDKDDGDSGKGGGAVGGAEVAVVDAARMLSKQFEAGFESIAQRAADRDRDYQEGEGQGQGKATSEDMSFLDANRAACSGGVGKYKVQELTSNRDGWMYEEGRPRDLGSLVAEMKKAPRFALLSLRAKLGLLQWSQDELLQTDFSRKHLAAAEGVSLEDEEEEQPKKGAGKKRKPKAGEKETSKVQAVADATGSAPKALHSQPAAANTATATGTQLSAGGADDMKIIRHGEGSTSVTTRVAPLGHGDRHNNRYWVFSDVANTEEVNMGAKERTVRCPAPALFVEEFATGQWHCYSSTEDYQALLCWLDERGKSENTTKDCILAWLYSHNLEPDYAKLKQASKARQMGLKLLQYGPAEVMQGAPVAATTAAASSSSSPGGPTSAPVADPSVPRPVPLKQNVCTHEVWDPRSVKYSAPTVSAAFLTSLLPEALVALVSDRGLKEMSPPGAVSSSGSHVVCVSPSESLGLRAGDHLVSCNGILINGLGAVRKEATKAMANPMTVLVRRHPENTYSLDSYVADPTLEHGEEPKGTFDESPTASHLAAAMPKRCIGGVLDVLARYDARVQGKDTALTALKFVPALHTELHRLLVSKHDTERMLTDSTRKSNALVSRYSNLVEVLGEALMALGKELFESDTALMGGHSSRLRKRWLEMVQRASTFSQLSVLSSILLLGLDSQV